MEARIILGIAGKTPTDRIVANDGWIMWDEGLSPEAVVLEIYRE